MRRDIDNGTASTAGGGLSALDRRNDSFKVGSRALVEAKSPVPSLSELIAYTDRCKASAARGRAWVDAPHIAIDRGSLSKERSIYFNAASLQEYGLDYYMALMPLATKNFTAVAFVLGREFFPNENAYNKYGYSELRAKRSGKTHKRRVGYTGVELPNPEWGLGYLQNDGISRLLYDGLKATGFHWDGQQAPLYLDKDKFTYRGNRRHYYVLYFKPAELYDPDTMSDTDKLVAEYSQIERRQKWTDEMLAKALPN